MAEAVFSPSIEEFVLPRVTFRQDESNIGRLWSHLRLPEDSRVSLRQSPSHALDPMHGILAERVGREHAMAAPLVAHVTYDVIIDPPLFVSITIQYNGNSDARAFQQPVTLEALLRTFAVANTTGHGEIPAPAFYLQNYIRGPHLLPIKIFPSENGVFQVLSQGHYCLGFVQRSDDKAPYNGPANPGSPAAPASEGLAASALGVLSSTVGTVSNTVGAVFGTVMDAASLAVSSTSSALANFRSGPGTPYGKKDLDEMAAVRNALFSEVGAVRTVFEAALPDVFLTNSKCKPLFEPETRSPKDWLALLDRTMDSTRGLPPVQETAKRVMLLVLKYQEERAFRGRGLVTPDDPRNAMCYFLKNVAVELASLGALWPADQFRWLLVDVPAALARLVEWRTFVPASSTATSMHSTLDAVRAELQRLAPIMEPLMQQGALLVAIDELARQLVLASAATLRTLLYIWTTLRLPKDMPLQRLRTLASSRVVFARATAAPADAEPNAELQYIDTSAGRMMLHTLSTPTMRLALTVLESVPWDLYTAREAAAAAAAAAQVQLGRDWLHADRSADRLRELDLGPCREALATAQDSMLPDAPSCAILVEAHARVEHAADLLACWLALTSLSTDAQGAYVVAVVPPAAIERLYAATQLTCERLGACLVSMYERALALKHDLQGLAVPTCDERASVWLAYGINQLETRQLVSAAPKAWAAAEAALLAFMTQYRRTAQPLASPVLQGQASGGSEFSQQGLPEQSTLTLLGEIASRAQSWVAAQPVGV